MTKIISSWNLNSRVHPLRSFPPDCYVKRDDELSCGISGTKWRKYASLMPALIQQDIQRLLIIAGPQSNNLLAALQMARENGLEVTAFLLKPWSTEVRGNFKLSLFFLDESEIIWVERAQWHDVEAMAMAYKKQSSDRCFLLTEGASVGEALEGAMTLGDDILRNEAESGLRFEHIFVDAGTGFSAIALLKSLTEKAHPALVHILLLADDEATFNQKLLSNVDLKPERIHLFKPQTAKAFGAVNQTIKDEIKRAAREEGLLLDPVYSAKLFHASRELISREKLEGSKLIIHSGGILSLGGFDV